MVKKALILIDIQNDFCAGGQLAVPDADAIVPLANQLQRYFTHVIATQDWHPQDHASFASNHPGRQVGEVIELNHQPQILWPNHCLQHSPGAQLHPELKQHAIEKIFFKGTDKNIDSYSAFYDNAHLRATGLGDYLQELGIQEVYLLGLATDYCVKYSALDAVKLGFRVYVVQDACRAVNLQPEDAEKAFHEMQQAGVKLIASDDVAKKT